MWYDSFHARSVFTLVSRVIGISLHFTTFQFHWAELDTLDLVTASNYNLLLCNTETLSRFKWGTQFRTLMLLFPIMFLVVLLPETRKCSGGCQGFPVGWEKWMPVVAPRSSHLGPVLPWARCQAVWCGHIWRPGGKTVLWTSLHHLLITSDLIGYNYLLQPCTA